MGLKNHETMSELRRHTLREIREALPVDSIERAFYRRKDIACLPADEAQRRWKEHRVKVQRFLAQIASIPSIIVDES